MVKPKISIGRVEKVDFPDMEMFDINAKIDTGAYSSSIHCHDIIENLEEKILSFKLLDPSHPNYNEKEIQFTDYSKVKVKSSTGVSQNRYKIKTAIKIGRKTYITNFTLTNRRKMRYPVLLGRKMLGKRFVVDVSHKYLLNPKV